MGDFYAMLLGIFNKQVPIIEKKVKDKPSPWLTSELKKKINKRDKRLRKCRNTSDVNNGRSSDMSDRFETLAGQIKAKTREMSEQNN